jgi:dihydroorotate dehydrogenase (fumarate)
MGLRLSNPIVPGASPLTADLETVKQLVEHGAPAVVLHSLFEEQITHEQEELHHFTTQGSELYAEMLSFFPEPEEYRLGPEEYLEHIGKVKAATGVPVIASLNGVTAGGWTEYAKKMEAAGADALELNVYYVAADIATDSAAVEKRYVDILKGVKSAVSIPVAMKLSPFFSATGAMAAKLDEAGADALVLFNRFYQPDIDLEELEVAPSIQLSTSGELRLPLRWIAILHDRIKADLAATTGVHSGSDAIKAVMAGADIVQVCAVLLKHGPQQLASIIEAFRDWSKEREYVSVAQMRGSLSQKASPDPAAFERANYMKALSSYA